MILESVQSAAMENFVTVTQLAVAAGVTPDRIRYTIRREGIQAAAWVGHTKLYHNRDFARIVTAAKTKVRRGPKPRAVEAEAEVATA